MRYMGVSENSGTPKSSIFIRIFHYKPSILGYPYFWKHPCEIMFVSFQNCSTWLRVELRSLITKPSTFIQTLCLPFIFKVFPIHLVLVVKEQLKTGADGRNPKQLGHTHTNTMNEIGKENDNTTMWWTNLQSLLLSSFRKYCKRQFWICRDMAGILESLNGEGKRG